MKNKTNEKFRQKQYLKQVVCIVSLEFNWYRTYLTMYQSVQTNLAIVDIVDIILSTQQLNAIFANSDAKTKIKNVLWNRNYN